VASGPVTLLLGDLSLLHDLTGLAAARKVSGALAVVVVQNGGGRIFDQLPLAASAPADVFERCFATPEDVCLADAAAAFGVNYARAETRSELDAELAAAWSRPSVTLIEAIARPKEGGERMAKLWAELRAELSAQ